MQRREFIKDTILLSAMMSTGTFKNFAGSLEEQDVKMPVLFMGHGSPMNGIQSNEFSNKWKELGKTIPQPRAVICISAHWLTRGTHITAMNSPRTIHDFGGFPEDLHKVQYPAPGNPKLANETKELVKKTQVGLNHDWGLDHGTWTMVRHMYPKANIPVLQFSIDYYKDPQYHYDLARELAALRKKGVLIIGSGNMVHNLGMIAWDKLDAPEYGFDWAIEMNTLFKKHIADGNHQALIAWEKLNKAARLAIPTPDHYLPLIYTLALQDKNEKASFFNDKAVGGSLTMTSVAFGA